MITEAEYQDHDCHLSSEDGCSVCQEWFEQTGQVPTTLEEITNETYV